jgi:putative nucleotidyltransferase with HDIG domain
MEDYVRDRIGKIEVLPTFPSIVGEVMSIIEDPKSSASDLVKHMDPSLVGEVLKVANSAYFGRKSFRHITTVEQAVATIGYSSLSSIVLQMPFLSMLKGRDDGFDRRWFVRHSLVTGVMARTICASFSLGNSHTVYVSGLLHDIGSIVIYEHFGKEWDLINRLVAEKQVPRVHAEREALSMDHAAVGALLLEKWDLPEAIIDAVRLHHCPEMLRDNENAYAIWLANALAKAVDFQKELADFGLFFDKQRQLLQAEMPERYLLKHHVGLFEQAYSNIQGIEEFLAKTAGEKND